MGTLRRDLEGGTSTRPRVLLIAGIPGAGKSTLAEKAGELLSAPVISKDWICRYMFPKYSGAEQQYWAAVDATISAVSVHVRSGTSCIFDGMSFRQPGLLEYVATRVATAGGEAKALHLECPANIAASRIEGDEFHPSADRVPEMAFYMHEEFRALPSDVPVIDATQNLQRVHAGLSDILREWGWLG